MQLTDDALLEECLDELDVAFEKLERFPEEVLLEALAAHLIGLTHVLVERGRLTQDDVTEFSQVLVSELTQSVPEEPGIS